MSDQQQHPQVQLPGYELIEKIGAGGYGEVWSVIAPGGMRKAVKFVFGGECDKRATSELHALEKIKSVRHPFLLSLERIEIVEGRLVVVSELADCSLRDRFVECVEEGLPGIPRDELLSYLSDAADVLDYIGEQHNLAHLDIKPDNLLLLGGHVKVADFGLVKSLNNQTQASLVGGMTPTYAAPEVFLGSPSRQSDQYSLAILYQEMLTGSVPFPGVNAAELTLQHMKDDPDLVRLPEADRFPAARALSKEASHRFASCGEMVSAIRIAGTISASSPAASPGSAPVSAPPISKKEKLDRHSVTEVFAESTKSSQESDGKSLGLSPEALPHPDPVLEALPDLTAGDESFTAAPAVFIGVGGTGARVLRSLRAQMNEHLGSDVPLAAAPMLLLDTDPQTLATATSGRGLDAAETVSLPLRRPQEYRDKADLLLRWLGRRWLYNIPRTLRTEGIRPLGRLALVDHARQAFQRIRGVLMSAVDEASREESTAEVGLSFAQPGVRVYVVGSASGAVGSGMSLDIAYAVRSILNRIGAGEATLIGVMTHSTYREATRGDLARVNAYAWLSEFEQYRSSTQGYPGDSSIGLPAHEPGVPAFDHTYFVPMGERIGTPEFESGADAIAEYLFADAFTPSQRLLDACRQDVDGGSTVRSFAVRHRNGQAESALGPLERHAAIRMVDRWLGPEDEAPASSELCVKSTDQVVHGAVAFLGRTQLDSTTLATNCRSLLEASLGGDSNAFLENRCVNQPSCKAADLIEAIDQVFEIDSVTGSPVEINGKPIERLVVPLVHKFGDEVSRWVLGRVNETQERLEGAGRAADWLRDHLVALDSDLSKVMASVISKRSHYIEDAPTRPLDVEATRAARSKLFSLRLDEAGLVAARHLVAALQTRLQELPAALDDLHRVVTSLRSELGETPAAGADGVSLPEAQALSLEIERRLQNDYLTAQDGLLGALLSHEAKEQLLSTILHAARVVAREHRGSRAASDAAMTAGFADPPLTGAGGVYRRLTLSQPSAQADDPSTAPAEDELLLVTEMANVSLPHVAASVINERRDYAAFAERVRTRRDIAWVDPITSGSREAPEAPPAFDTGPVETQALQTMPVAIPT